MVLDILPSFVKISKRVLELLSGHGYLRKFSKGHNSIKMLAELQFLTSTYYLTMLYICTKFHENIAKGFRVIERTRLSN